MFSNVLDMDGKSKFLSHAWWVQSISELNRGKTIYQYSDLHYKQHIMSKQKKNRQHRATSILYFNFRFSALSNPIYFEHISVTHMEFHKFEVPQNILHFYSVQNTDKKFRKTLISFIYILIRGTVGDVQQTLMRILFERYFFSFLTLSAWSLKFSHNFRRCPTNNKKCQSTALIFLSSVLFLSFPFHSFLYI